METIMNAKVLHVAKTTTQWENETSVISKGLICIEFTSDGKTKAKVGDGVKTYTQLPYLSDGSINITDYYTKSETDDNITAAINEFKTSLGSIITIKGVKNSENELPTTGNNIGDLWFVGTESLSTDSFSEFIWSTENKWEFIGRISAEVDLSGYATIEFVNNEIKKVDDRIKIIEDDYIKSTDTLILNCTL